MQQVERKWKVLAFVALHHVEQKRKYTHEPYLFHLRAVADASADLCNFGFEVGLCHDLLEDTICTKLELYEALKRFGYTRGEAIFIVSRVEDLTDLYIPEKFPDMNRKARKSLEALRLHEVHPDSQTVKYKDMDHNLESIVLHDPGFAKTIIPEFEAILLGMNKGDRTSYKAIVKKVAKAKKQLKIS